MGFFSAIKSTLSSSLTKLAQAPKAIKDDYVLSQAISTKRIEVRQLEKKLIQLERSTDSFSAATGQRVERSDVMMLRQVLNYKKAELQNLQNEQAKQGTWFPSTFDLARNIKS